MSDLKSIFESLDKFREERDWKQFHDPKNLGIALSIEASELNELFLWKDKQEVEKVDPELVQDELADILSYALLIAQHYDFDIKKIIQNKIAKNGLKYPIEKSKGNSKKYSEL